jgi:hypothetical protein
MSYTLFGYELYPLHLDVHWKRSCRSAIERFDNFSHPNPAKVSPHLSIVF